MLHRLRQATLITRCVLVWFVLAIGVASASPLVQPQIMELVCAASGVVKLQAKGGDDDPGASPLSHGVECALCLPLDGPATAAAAQTAATVPAAEPRPARSDMPPATDAAARPPARGPPAVA